MPSIPLRRRTSHPDLLNRTRSELQRVLGVLDEAAMTGNLARLGQAFAADALSEVRARFSAYQMAGIQVSPFRESLHLELVADRTSTLVRAKMRYRDRTSFLCAGAQPTTANEPVQLLVTLDPTQDPWRVVSLAEE